MMPTSRATVGVLAGVLVAMALQACGSDGTKSSLPDAAVVRAGDRFWEAQVSLITHRPGQSSGGASFKLFEVTRDPAPCPTAEFGACRLVKCAAVVPQFPVTEVRRASVGTIVVTFPSRVVMMEETMDAGTTWFNGFSVAEELWTGGESIRVEALGGPSSYLPPFSLSVTAPGFVVVSEPTTDTFGEMRVQHGADLSITWAPASAGDLRAVLRTTERWLECRFPLSAQRGTIPAAALAGLEAPQVTYEFDSITTTTTTVMDVPITLTATTNVRLPNERNAFGYIRFVSSR